MITNRKPGEKMERKHFTVAEEEWNRTGYDYSNLWRMYDDVVSSVEGIAQKAQAIQ